MSFRVLLTLTLRSACRSLSVAPHAPVTPFVTLSTSLKRTFAQADSSHGSSLIEDKQMSDEDVEKVLQPSTNQPGSSKKVRKSSSKNANVITTTPFSSSKHGKPQTSLIKAYDNNSFGKAVDLIKTGIGLDEVDKNGKTALHRSSSAGDFVLLVPLLIQKGANINLQDNLGLTPLMCAIHYNRFEAVKNLVENGADLEMTDKEGRTAVFFAVAKKNLKSFELLIEYGASIEHKDNQGKTALESESLDSAPEFLQLLKEKLVALSQKPRKTPVPPQLSLGSHDPPVQTPVTLQQEEKSIRKKDEKGANSSTKNEKARTTQVTALEVALSQKDMESAQILIENGADLNSKNTQGHTLLMKFVNKNDIESVRLLIEKGADLNLKNDKGKTALDIALFKEDESIIQLLEEKGTTSTSSSSSKKKNLPDHSNILKKKVSPQETSDDDINRQDSHGWTPLMKSINKKDLETVKRLVEKGADLNLKNDKGLTALMIAIGNKDLESAQTLIDNGADLNLKNDQGWTALMTATNKKDLQTVQILIEKGADLNLQNSQGWTALMIAVAGEDHESVRLLIEKGADLNLKNDKGKTALDIALFKRDNSIMQLLKKKGTTSTSSSSSKEENLPDHSNILRKTTSSQVISDSDLNLQKAQGWTPMKKSIISKDHDVLDVLTETKVDLDLPRKKTESDLFSALEDGNVQAAMELIEKGADVDLKNGKKWTPLMVAISNFHNDVALLLLQKGADLNYSDGRKQSALSIAISKDNFEGLKLLLENGAKP